MDYQLTTTASTVTVDNSFGGYWNTGYWYPVYAPTDCCGDIHVFPCPHCNRCKCGKARKDK